MAKRQRVTLQWRPNEGHHGQCYHVGTMYPLICNEETHNPNLIMKKHQTTPNWDTFNKILTKPPKILKVMTNKGRLRNCQRPEETTEAC
jgi:hypothetical protein